MARRVGEVDALDACERGEAVASKPPGGARRVTGREVTSRRRRKESGAAAMARRRAWCGDRSEAGSEATGVRRRRRCSSCCRCWCCGRASAAVEAEAEEDSSSSEEEEDGEEEEDHQERCCCGLLRVIPAAMRDYELLGGLVTVSEDLIEFGADGRVLAVLESNAMLVVILSLTFADLFATVATTECPHPAICAVFPGWPETAGLKVFSNAVLGIFAIEIFVRLRQFKVCRSFGAFFANPFCVLDLTLVTVDLCILAMTRLISGLVSQYAFLKPVGTFASNGRILRAVRIFRMMRAVRAAKAVQALKKSQDLFEAAAEGNFADVIRTAKASRRGALRMLKTDGPLSRRQMHLARVEAERTKLWKANSFGETALHVAAKYGHHRIVAYLADRESCESVDPRDWTTGATPLWNSALGGHETAARVLLAKGADWHLAPLTGELRGVTAREMLVAKKWRALVDEAEALRAAEIERGRLREDRRRRRVYRREIAKAEADNAAREADRARRRDRQARLERGLAQLRVRVGALVERRLRSVWTRWHAHLFSAFERSILGTVRGRNCLARAKHLREEARRVASDPLEQARRAAQAKDRERQKRHDRRAAAANRIRINSERQRSPPDFDAAGLRIIRPLPPTAKPARCRDGLTITARVADFLTRPAKKLANDPPPSHPPRSTTNKQKQPPPPATTTKTTDAIVVVAKKVIKGAPPS